MSEIFESLMIISFGISWPISIGKSFKSKTTKGKSILFIMFILCGYGFGITSKLLASNISYVLVFYILNFVMVSIDACLFIKNSKLDRKLSDTKTF